MDIEQKITKHLVKKYAPIAILLTGSRAKGLANPNSDWDIIILTKNRNEYRGELFAGQELDTSLRKISDIKKYVLASSWSPYQIIKVLYDDSHGKVARIINETNKAYLRGPKRLSQAELQARKNFDRRKINKLKTLVHNQNGFFEYSGIFFNGVIKHWFELRKLWPIDPIRSLEYFKKHDPKFFKMLSTISGRGSNSKKLKAANQIYRHLYERI